jgi:hypothetical protein
MSLQDSHGNATEAQSLGTVPAASLVAKSTAGPGTALDGLCLRSTAVLVVTSGAGVSAGSVQLQGSLDGVNFYNLGAAVSTATASSVFAPVIVTGTAARFVRATIATAITGGTVGAYVALSG